MFGSCFQCHLLQICERISFDHNPFPNTENLQQTTLKMSTQKYEKSL